MNLSAIFLNGTVGANAEGPMLQSEKVVGVNKTISFISYLYYNTNIIIVNQKENKVVQRTAISPAASVL